MKALSFFSLALFFLFGAALAEGPALPDQVGVLNDFAGVIDGDTRLKIEKICADLKEFTGYELVLVTMNATAPMEQKAYTDRLFEKWKVGHEGWENGVLFLLSIVDKKVEIKVGAGLSRLFPEAKAHEMLDYAVIAYLARGEFSEAMLNGAAVLAKEITDRYTGAANRPPSRGAAILPYVLLIIVIIVVLSMLIKADFANIFGGIGGVAVGFLFFQTITAVIIGAFAGFLLGYGDAIIRGRRFNLPK